MQPVVSGVVSGEIFAKGEGSSSVLRGAKPLATKSYSEGLNSAKTKPEVPATHAVLRGRTPQSMTSKSAGLVSADLETPYCRVRVRCRVIPLTPSWCRIALGVRGATAGTTTACSESFTAHDPWPTCVRWVRRRRAIRQQTTKR